MADVRAALDEAGVPYDRKKFRPHVTLVRRAEWPYDLQVSDLAEAPRASMDVERVCLMKSERIGGKLVYTPVGEVKK